MNELLYGTNSCAIVCLKRSILSFKNGIRSILYSVLFYCCCFVLAASNTVLLLLLLLLLLLYRTRLPRLYTIHYRFPYVKSIPIKRGCCCCFFCCRCCCCRCYTVLVAIFAVRIVAVAVVVAVPVAIIVRAAISIWFNSICSFLFHRSVAVRKEKKEKKKKKER